MDLVVTTPSLPSPGQTVLGRAFDTICGGKGANQAIAAARAGGRVAMIGAVGDDAFGAQLRASLIADGVLADAVRTVAGPSGIASITVDEQAENTIVVVPGANSAVRDLTAAEQAILGAASIVVCQLEIPVATVVHAGAIAAAAGKPMLLNPSPIQPLSWALLSNTSVLVYNEGEASAVGAEAVDEVFHVVTTLGAAGARYRGPDGEELTVPSPRVERGRHHRRRRRLHRGVRGGLERRPSGPAGSAVGLRGGRAGHHGPRGQCVLAEPTGDRRSGAPHLLSRTY